MPPSIPMSDNVNSDNELMPTIRRVIKYSGLNYHQAIQLPCDLFLLMAKNDYIDELNQSEEGRQYLDKCRRLNTTEIDLEGVKEIKNQLEER